MRFMDLAAHLWNGHPKGERKGRDALGRSGWIGPGGSPWRWMGKDGRRSREIFGIALGTTRSTATGGEDGKKFVTEAEGLGIRVQIAS
jgi:hypothetical protein